MYDPFLFLTGDPFIPAYQHQTDIISGFKGYAVVNVSMDGSVSECSTLSLLGLGIAGLGLKLRRRNESFPR